MGLGLLLIGGAVLLVCVLGCIGAHSEKVLLLMPVSSVNTPPSSQHPSHRCFLSQYLALLVVLVLGQLFVAVLLVINRDKVSMDAAVQDRRRPQCLFRLVLSSCQIGRSLDETVDQLISQYSEDRSGPNRLLDSIQRQVSAVASLPVPSGGH